MDSKKFTTENNKQNHWVKPSIKSHGDMSEITKGIEELGGDKEVGGDDGGAWLGQPVSS